MVVLGEHFFFVFLSPFPLNEDYFPRQLFQRNIILPHQNLDDILLLVIFLIGKHRHIFFHVLNDAHIHAAHELLQIPRNIRGVRPSLTGDWLAVA